MGCGGRSSRFILSGLRRCNSMIAVRSNPIQEFVSRRTFSWRSNLGEATILRNRGKTQKRESPFVDGAKRFYNWGSNNQLHESNAGRGWRRWLWHLETSVVLASFSIVVGLDVWTGKWETVPFTKRRQLLLFRPSFNEDAGPRAEKYEKMKKDLRKIVLPPAHPDCVRVRKIAGNLLEAFRRKEGDARIKKRWEVLIINVPSHRIISSSGGKIAVFGGVLSSCREDAEIAALIAPEVGRVVARHSVEKSSMVELLSFLFLLILHVIISSMPSLQKSFRFPLARSLFYCVTLMAVSRLLNKICSLKMDVEADYIGLMLLASAGYDPRVALQAREKMLMLRRNKGGGSWWEKMRARLLVLDMEEALSIYREVMAEHD